MTAYVPAPPQRGTSIQRTRHRLIRRVEKRLNAFLAAEHDRWGAANQLATAPIEAVADLVNAGGKRIRPTFCLSGYLAAGGDPEADEIVNVAAALELLHTCALLHDDVMDESPRRRGRPTAHARHAAEHENSRWQGDPRRFGESVAILAGDLALIYSDHFMTSVPPNVSRLWSELRAELVIGQYLDVRAAAEFSVDPELARWIAVAKSGHYSIHRPLAMGAALAGGTELFACFEEFGIALGQAFQLRDDLIDAFGDPEVTGKPVGLDFRQHRMTLLAALAMRRNAQVRDLILDGGADTERLHKLLVETGVRTEIETTIDDLVARSCRAVDDAPIARCWREELAAMARQVAYRDR